MDETTKVTHKPPKTTADPDQINAIFAAMIAAMGTDWTVCNSTLNFTTGGGQTGTCNLSDQYGNAYNVTMTQGGNRISVAPTFISLGPGETQQFTATVMDNTGATVPNPTLSWKVTGTGTIDAAGLYTAPATIPNAIVDTVTVTDSTGASVGTSVSLHP